MHASWCCNDEGVQVGAGKFFWPLSLMLLASATEFIPPAASPPRSFTAEESIHKALEGQNPDEMAREVAQHAARSIDVLRVMLTEEDSAGAALAHLKALAARASGSIEATQPALVK